MKKIKDYDDNCPIDDTLKLISKKMGDIYHQRHIFRKKTIQRISRRKNIKQQSTDRHTQIHGRQ